MSYKTVLTTAAGEEIVNEYTDHSLDQVRAFFIHDLKSRGYTIETPIVGWKEIGIDNDGVKQMRFVYERYYFINYDRYNHATAEIRDNDFHV